MSSMSAYERLISLLNQAGARYRVIDHIPEGRTEMVSQLRGHHPKQAAKCMILMLKLGRKTTKFVLAVVPGDKKVDFKRLRALLGATYISFASSDDAERLGGCGVGTILPFALENSLDLIVDTSILEVDEIFFNAGRLDQSIALDTKDYLAITNPHTAVISE